MQSVRVYNQRLYDSDIRALANEFSRITPAPNTTSISTPKKANAILTSHTGALFDTFSAFPF